MNDEQRDHELASALKALALELGETPSAEIARQRIPGLGNWTRTRYKSYSVFLSAIGLDPVRPKQSRKIDDSIFTRPIERHLEEFKPSTPLARQPWPRIAVISDIHWPFSSQQVIDAFYAFLESHGADHVILNGDAWDMYSHSRFPRSHNVFTPRDEQRVSRERNEEFWREVKKRAPEAICTQMLGNHDLRPMKRVLEEYPEAEDWIAEKMKELFTFPGVNTILDPREEFMIGDIMIHHGYRSRLGDHRDYTRFNSIIGHTHRGGCVFRTVRGEQIWELNSGYAGDPTSKGLTYTPQRITDWTPGFGYVDEHGPRFIPV